MASHSVLIVEDTDLIRKIYADKLAQEGYQVHVASNGLEALSQLRAEAIDLILLDLIMPVMSGLEAMEAIKADPRTQDIPVIVLSNLGQEADIERGLQLGAVDYLVKNEAKPADVVEKIALVLDHAANRANLATSYRLRIRDREGDVERFISENGLRRRFWCPACEAEYFLELVPNSKRPGWFEAHLICEMCGKGST
ncbi:MAG: response regulator [Actinobacteria bacterium]|nr:response regulator [Actinomycetota bacterium]